MLEYFKDWLAHPFRIDMDALHWFMFLGMIFIIVGLWNRVLAHMGEGF